tara:strand:+ start:226 stop:399 length:174 start_codon:yes stop_codon:yes gene_type:complete
VLYLLLLLLLLRGDLAGTSTACMYVRTQAAAAPPWAVTLPSAVGKRDDADQHTCLGQ